MEKVLITAGTILAISSPPLIKGSILIVDGKIREIGKASKLKKKYQGIPTLELGDGILLPGFVNAHTHLELGWIGKRIGKFSGFISWLKHIIKARMADTTREEIETSVEEGIKMLLQCGVTTIGEISSFGKDETFEERPFPHAIYSCSPEFLKKVWRFNHQRGIPLGIHLAESPDEVKFLRGEENGFEKKIFPLIGKAPFVRDKTDTPFQYLKELKFFNGTKVTAVHMVQILPEEVEEI